MEYELSGIDIHFLVKELKEIEGGKIEKIYQWKNDFIIRIYKQGSKYNLRINLPHLMYLTEKDYQGPRHPPEYCMFLRKYIQKGRIKNVTQKDLDRVVIIEVESREGTFFLVTELLSPGNVSLCDESYEVIHPLEKQVFSNREIKSKKTYEFPPARLNPLEAHLDDINEALDDDEKIVSELAVKLGLGGDYSEEVLYRLDIDKEKQVKDVDLQRVFDEIQALLTQDIEPYLSKQGIHPIRMETHDVKQEYETYTQALDDNTILLEDDTQEEKKTKQKGRNEKLKTIIDAQQKQVESLKQKIQKNQRKAEVLYEHYQKFSHLIDKANTLIEEEGLEKAEEELRKLDYVVNFDPEKKEVTIEIDT